MPDFTAYPHPTLAVRCPTCQSAPGLRCRRLSGPRASDLHAERGAEVDRVFIEQHGWEASIARDGDGWIIHPRGRANLRPQPDKMALI